MMIQNVSSQDRSAHFDRIAGDARYDIYEGHPMMTEYRRLYEECCVYKRRVYSLEKDNNNLNSQLTEMKRSLELAARIDPMTGLRSRRDMMEKIECEFSCAERHKRTFSVMLADLDNFKRVNELYGYNAGDDVLVEVARVLMSCIRNEDVCARWGGEQFLFLLPETNIDGALSVAQKIKKSISMSEFKVRRPGIFITISLGLCEYRTGWALTDTITLADQALQKAKQDGRNRCVVAGL